jgi:Na+/proline symporter
LTSLCCFVGLVLYANNYKCDPLTSPIDKVNNPNQLVGYFVNKHLSMIPGVAGLFLGSLFCGSLSSVSSSLNSQAAIIWTDFLQMLPYFKKFNDSKSLKANKIIVLICGSISTSLSFVIAIVGGNLTQISISLNGALNTPMIGLFLLGICFKFTNKYGAIIGSLCGLFSGLWISLGAYIVKPYYPKLCVTTEFCYANSSSINYVPSCSPLSSYSGNSTEGFKHFYSMSYMWYTTFGTLNTLIVGILVSCATGGYKKLFKKNNKIFSF